MTMEITFADRLETQRQIMDAVMTYGAAKFEQGMAFGITEFEDKIKENAEKAFDDLLAITTEVIVKPGLT
jgi:hypothetical protein